MATDLPQTGSVAFSYMNLPCSKPSSLKVPDMLLSNRLPSYWAENKTTLTCNIKYSACTRWFCHIDRLRVRVKCHDIPGCGSPGIPWRGCGRSRSDGRRGSGR